MPPLWQPEHDYTTGDRFSLPATNDTKNTWTVHEVTAPYTSSKLPADDTYHGVPVTTESPTPPAIYRGVFWHMLQAVGFTQFGAFTLVLNRPDAPSLSVRMLYDDANQWISIPAPLGGGITEDANFTMTFNGISPGQVLIRVQPTDEYLYADECWYEFTNADNFTFFGDTDGRHYVTFLWRERSTHPCGSPCADSELNTIMNQVSEICVIPGAVSTPDAMVYISSSDFPDPMSINAALGFGTTLSGVRNGIVGSASYGTTYPYEDYIDDLNNVILPGLLTESNSALSAESPPDVSPTSSSAWESSTVTVTIDGSSYVEVTSYVRIGVTGCAVMVHMKAFRTWTVDIHTNTAFIEAIGYSNAIFPIAWPGVFYNQGPPWPVYSHTQGTNWSNSGFVAISGLPTTIPVPDTWPHWIDLS